VNIERTLSETPVVTGVEFVRTMRGECQASLVRANDGHHYVVKACNNPQGPRILVNEFLSHHLMNLIGLATPAMALAKFPDHIGGSDDTVHFASRVPGHPAHTAVYDFLPNATLLQVLNRREFFGSLVFDQWVSNCDRRQLIFFQNKFTSRSRGAFWYMQFIDNGRAFGGKDWTLRDAPVIGTYMHKVVYKPEVSYKLFQPWVERVMAIDENAIKAAVAAVPPSWIQGNELELSHLIYKLLLRRERLQELVMQSVNWLRRDGRPISMKPRRPVAAGSFATDPAAMAC
jgi:hypothetical protein